ncbi:MAG: proline iminopeptidase-family hydrolase [Candidatus Omnitrophica bacterium]|nr:proline iminopeptidase-family hydrolase [Candidatus Omnitrophota bacterium]
MKEDIHQGYMQVEGGKVWYGISGADKPLTPLIVLHGGPGAPHHYLEPLNGLAAERPVIFYDQLGCGNSDRPKDVSLWTIGHFTQELDTVRRELGLEKLHILGQSWGTMLAVDYMLAKKPAGIMSLVLSSPCLSTSRWHDDCRRLISEMEANDRDAIMESEARWNFDSDGYKKAIKDFYGRHLCRLSSWPDCITKTFENMGNDVYEHMWGPSEFTITGTLKGYERAGELKEITVPALFTCGRYDEATPASTEYYHKMMPGSELVVFEDASHMHHVEKTDLYLRTVESFIRRFDR